MEDDQRKDTLLACVGKEIFGLQRALVAPTKLKDKTCGELMETLRVHLAPIALVIAEKFRFYKRDQKEMEGIKAYMYTLACKSWLNTVTLETCSQRLGCFKR